MPRRLVFDIEGNGLLADVTKVHCIAIGDPDTGERLDFKSDGIPRALEVLESADLLIAHFGLGYDFPALEKVHGFTVPVEKQHDTVVSARLMFPNIAEADAARVQRGRMPGAMVGKHSMEAWGYRLNRPKLHTEIEDWSVWTPEMHERCIGDVETNVALWKHLQVDDYSQRAIELEHRVARLVFKMEAAGVPFDEKGAQALMTSLVAKRETLEKELVAEFGFWYEPCKKRLDEHGLAEVFIPKRDDKKRGYVTGAPFTKVEKVTFNPGSRRHAVKKLMQLGWTPQDFTGKGDPTLSDEVLESMSDNYPQARKLVEYLLLDKRLGMLSDGDQAWLQVVHKDGRIRGSMNPMGTPHSRASHYSPNMAQVPANKKLYGTECRRLFGAGHAGPDWVQVGADMSGLQQRALGHYLAPIDGGTYAQMVATEDIHWVYTRALELVAEDVARDKTDPLHEIVREMGGKRFGYAYLFGCFPAKSGAVMRDCCIAARQKGFPDLYERYFGNGETNRQVGERVRKTFDERLKLGELQRRLLLNYQRTHRWKHHLPGLDGRWVPCRSEHSLLNYALSSAEAILCKTWICDAFDELERKGLKHGWDGDFVFMLWVHDELQTATRSGLEQEVGNVLVACAKGAGEKLGFRVPVQSEFKIGRTWADCH